MSFVGIDISKDFFSFFFNNSLKGILPNSIDGYESLVSLFPDKSTSFVLESTGVYSKNLFGFLFSHGFKNLFYVSPFDVSKTRKILNLPKTDKLDAILIQKVALKFPEKLVPFLPNESFFISLKELTRFRFYLSSQLVKEKTYLANLISSYFPGLSSNLNLSNTLLNILSDYSAEDIVNMSIDELFDIVSSLSKKRLNIDFTKKLKSIISKVYRSTLNDFNTANFTISLTFDRVKLLKSQIKSIDKQLKFYFDRLNTTLHTIPGISVVLAVSIISEIVDINRFKSHSKLASYAGLRWDLNDSGKVVNNHKSLSKKGNKYLRYYLYQAASSAIRFDPVLRDYYKSKRNEGKAHKAAVVLTARKLVRSIYYMLKNNVPYKPFETTHVSN
ncbi:IS110 family transposase [Thermosipho ferrireducens]|uniref:IS110 family transposase n=1 Tax=Thermosipho ferrireducens TaxID=2571116 RepID=A0ABX7SAL5_9BACT|nr:IS110 family transposase [Thermosipho ferrireducens]QTA38807.1 IS110 family transposase [Thermosipho ferrireducens]